VHTDVGFKYTSELRAQMRTYEDRTKISASLCERNASKYLINTQLLYGPALPRSGSRRFDRDQIFAYIFLLFCFTAFWCPLGDKWTSSFPLMHSEQVLRINTVIESSLIFMKLVLTFAQAIYIFHIELMVLCNVVLEYQCFEGLYCLCL